MKKIVLAGFFAALFATGCGDDKKTVIPTDLSRPTPPQPVAAGSGAGPKAGNTTGGGKAKSPGGEGKAD